MTREEAVSIIEGRVRVAEYVESSYVDGVDIEALRIAIKALSDVPDTNVGDMISRQAAIDALNEMKIYRPLDSDRYVISDCLNKIVNLPSAQQWIPISERRPAPHEPVIICSDKGVCHIGMDIDIERWMIDGKILCVDELGEFAWMPFPEPWKEGEE